MAELTTVARPYAKAAFQFADENGSLDQWSDMLAFASAVSLDESVQAYLQNPQITSAQKADAFTQLCAIN